MRFWFITYMIGWVSIVGMVFATSYTAPTPASSDHKHL